MTCGARATISRFRTRSTCSIFLFGCQNTGLWMMKWWRSAPKSVWVNNFLFNREHKRDDILCIWMVAESESESPNGVRISLLSNAHTSYRPVPDHTWQSNKLKTMRLEECLLMNNDLRGTTQTLPRSLGHPVVSASWGYQGILGLSGHPADPQQTQQECHYIVLRETQECSPLTQQYSTYQGVYYNE